MRESLSTFLLHFLPLLGNLPSPRRAKLIRQENSFRRRIALEEIEIHRHRAMINALLLNTFVPEHDLIASVYAAELEDE